MAEITFKKAGSCILPEGGEDMEAYSPFLAKFYCQGAGMYLLLATLAG
jgi:hypothetical protein